ncbi:cellulose synthase complex periplasmic endoglucanase BcsZ [Leptospirillum ferriphilum]|jgi:endoglucanase|uniref:cellulase n=2 Tax=Leptospirillum TaxID=179 RepID=A0A094WDL9_9BACT|nr:MULTISPECIES: cellulose synthase complex periplasmic endoglucanase BcsZ [Leptospirillum]AKS24378.1 hypothetical protein ABH19_12410 [Leptospirillum sp. Group II 'CF-1']EDZ40120.1 MAG: Endoglucanase [Leptospirillum sp. Group II '5-way CG']EIJ76094.1 MAG: Endoglucanase [Leptospirillum sp. Group II 'C75']KGA94585.1 Endoglucanase precursor [Leptospirillum ferriphilum]
MKKMILGVLIVWFFVSGAGLSLASGFHSAWKHYRACCIQPDGRVIDRGRHNVTTSEGEAYALFFALVDNDPGLFSRLLRWTRDNLSRGDLSGHLPAWLWGESKNGQWRILDQNSATDADLWVCFDLMEAGRLWHRPDYLRLGKRLAFLISLQDFAHLPGVGAFPLGGERGFHPVGTVWRTNPSYFPPFLLRFMENRFGGRAWGGLPRRFLVLVKSVSSCGFVPDWVSYVQEKGWQTDPVTGPLGSYDAIRVYLWVGMTSVRDPQEQILRKRLQGWARKGRPSPTLFVNTKTCSVYGTPPPGFLAAYLPFLRRQKAPSFREEFRRMLSRSVKKKDPGYYDTNLYLFGTGFLEKKFSFDEKGRLHVRW